jgi:hypothetical protein
MPTSAVVEGSLKLVEDLDQKLVEDLDQKLHGY